MTTSVTHELERTAAARAWVNEGRSQVSRMNPTLGSDQFLMRMTAHPNEEAFVVQDIFSPSLGALYKMSEGRILPEGIWGEKAHPATQGFEAVNDGRSDLAPCYTAWRASSYPMLQLLALPGLFPNNEVATDVSEQLYPKYFSLEFEKSGLMLGRLKATGGYHLFSHKPIKKLEDFTNLTIAVNDGIDKRIAERLGAKTVTLNSVELLMAFEKGDVDAVSLADGSADVFGIGICAEYRLNLGMSMMNLEFGLNPTFYRSLPPDLQVILNNWLRIQAQVETQILYSLGGALARKKFIAHGCQFIELEDSELEKLKICMEQLSKDITVELDQQGYAASELVSEAQSIAKSIWHHTADELLISAINNPRMLLPV